MIEYYDLLNEEEQDDMRDLIQLLLRQTFLLERKYDRRAGRMVPVREYRFADRHLDFLKEYFRKKHYGERSFQGLQRSIF